MGLGEESAAALTRPVKPAPPAAFVTTGLPSGPAEHEGKAAGSDFGDVAASEAVIPNPKAMTPAKTAATLARKVQPPVRTAAPLTQPTGHDHVNSASRSRHGVVRHAPPTTSLNPCCCQDDSVGTLLLLASLARQQRGNIAAVRRPNPRLSAAVARVRERMIDWMGDKGRCH